MLSTNGLWALSRCMALALLTGMVQPAHAQDTTLSASVLRDRALAALVDIDTLDPAVRVERIKEAQAILARIETEFPESDEAILLLLDGSIGTLSKSDLAERLKIAMADSKTAAAAAVFATPDEPLAEPPATTPAAPETAKLATDTVAPVAAPDAAPPVATPDGSAAAVPLPEPGSPERAILVQAVALNLGLEVMPPDVQGATLLQIRGLLDQIVAGHPESDLALNIILQMPINGIDPADIDRRLADLAMLPDAAAASVTAPQPEATPAEVPASEVPASEVPAPDVSAPEIAAPVADLASETLLNLDRQGLRDVQARLLVLGFDPNGIDGEPGTGTRQALAAWQSRSGLPESGFLAAEHHARLVQQSQNALEIWLQDPQNMAAHTPPPPIELTAGNVGGNWSFTATCGKNSSFPGQTITGVLNIALTGNRSITGTAQNSQGFFGKVNGRLDDRRLSGEINWGLLLGRVSFSGQIASQSLSFSGNDSNGCRLRARKA
jgi:peptidoglycan hydrolase-like protein with peptidoglycan-binding domain